MPSTLSQACTLFHARGWSVLKDLRCSPARRSIQMARAMSPSHPVLPPWTWPWWYPAPGQYMTLVWVLLIHGTAVVGLILYPLPGWSLLFTAGALTWLGGLGTTVCYHRALAHRALRLHPLVRECLIF